jgi:hypothetical protein
MRMVGWTALCLLLTAPGSQLGAQSTIQPRWSVAGGIGFVFRSVQSGSFGAHLRAGPVISAGSGFYLEPAATWQGYLSSDAWGGGEDVPCPIEGCNSVPARDGISILGLELSAAYRKSGAENPIYPVAGIGVYRASAHDTTGARFGVNAGIVIPFNRSGVGPGMEFRYLRLFGDSRFKSLLPISLRWSF